MEGLFLSYLKKEIAMFKLSKLLKICKQDQTQLQLWA